jgi:hypothetical protein
MAGGGGGLILPQSPTMSLALADELAELQTIGATSVIAIAINEHLRRIASSCTTR